MSIINGWDGLPKITQRIVIGLVVFAIFTFGAFVGHQF